MQGLLWVLLLLPFVAVVVVVPLEGMVGLLSHSLPLGTQLSLPCMTFQFVSLK
jgi:hypothetical protein